MARSIVTLFFAPNDAHKNIKKYSKIIFAEIAPLPPPFLIRKIRPICVIRNGLMRIIFLGLYNDDSYEQQHNRQVKTMICE